MGDNWISVKCGKPLENTGVLMVIADRSYRWVQHGEYCDNPCEWFCYDENLNIVELCDQTYVTHWQPIPEPPL